MIKVLAKVTIKEGMMEALGDSVPMFIAATGKEEGCITCQLLQDVNNKNVFIILAFYKAAESYK